MTFLKTNIITLISKFICLAASLFISIYIARFLGPSTKGAYYLLVQMVAILATVSLFGVDYAAIFYLGKNFSAKSVVIVTNLFTIAIGIMMAALLFLSARTRLLEDVLLKTGFGYLAVILLTIPFMGVSRLNSAILMGFNKYVSFNILNIVLYLVMGINFVIFVIVLQMGLFGALLSYLSAYLILSVIYLAVIVTSKRFQDTAPSRDGVDLKTLLGYGVRAFLAPILLMVLYRADSFILNYYTTISAVGFYSVALSLAELLLFIPDSTGAILFPKLVYTSPEEVDKKFVFILKMSFALTLITAILFAGTIRYILPLVYGNLYTDSVRIAYLLLPGLVAMSAYYIFSSYFQAIGRPGLVTMVLAVVLASKVVLCGLLIPKFNSSGAAIACSISYGLSFIIFLSIFILRSKFKFKEIFTYKASDFAFIRSSLYSVFDFQK